MTILSLSRRLCLPVKYCLDIPLMKRKSLLESAAKTPFLLLNCSMSHVLSLFLAFLQDYREWSRHLEETLEYQSWAEQWDAAWYHVIGNRSRHLLVFGWVKFIKPSPLTHVLTEVVSSDSCCFLFSSLELLDVAEPGQMMNCEGTNMSLKTSLAPNRFRVLFLCAH